MDGLRRRAHREQKVFLEGRNTCVCLHRDGKEGRKQSQRNSWVVTSVHPGNMGEATYEELVEGEAGRVIKEQLWI